MNIEQIQKLNSRDLLELYSTVIRTNWYDPFKTPLVVEEIRNENISEEDILDIIVKRMSYE